MSKICEICQKFKGMFENNAFKNFKKSDWAIVGGGVVISLVLLAVVFGANKFFSKSPIVAEKEIAFTVFFRGVTVTDSVSPFKPEEETFITIRNVPYTKLKIVDVAIDRRAMLIETGKKGEYRPVEDISQPFLYDCAVTVVDKAKITDDGPVVGGNKVKIGIPVILEGKNYKLTGVVSNVQFVEPVKQEAQAAPQQNNDKAQK